jgi:hypothetical protein
MSTGSSPQFTKFKHAGADKAELTPSGAYPSVRSLPTAATGGPGSGGAENSTGAA